MAESLKFPKIVKAQLNKNMFIIHTDERAECFNTTLCVMKDQDNLEEEILCDNAVIADDHNLEVGLPNQLNYTRCVFRIKNINFL